MTQLSLSYLRVLIMMSPVLFCRNGQIFQPFDPNSNVIRASQKSLANMFEDRNHHYSIPYQPLSSANSNSHAVIVTTGVMMSSAASTGSPSQTPTHVVLVKNGVAQPTSAVRPVSNVSVVSPFSKSQSASSHQQRLCVVKCDTSSRVSPSTGPNALPLFAKELLSSDHAHSMLMKQDPVLVASNSGGGVADKEQSQSQDRLILPNALQLFEDDEHMPLETNDSTIHLSIDDIAHFAQPMTSSSGLTADGSHASFDTSLETSSFLSDIASETTNGTVNLPEVRSDSSTPSLPDEGEFPCSQCDKKFGNRRNLTSHLRRHTGDYKIYCDDCGKGFFTQSKLDSHKRKHTGMTSQSKNTALRSASVIAHFRREAVSLPHEDVHEAVPL